MAKTSRRSREAQTIRRRAQRAIAALERDVAAGVVSESFASQRVASLNQLIKDNTYDRASKSYGTSLQTAKRRARAAFEAYSASSASQLRKAPESERRRFITPQREAAKKADIESALRGELSLEKMEDAEEFIKATSDLWAGHAPEDRLRVIAEKLGWKKGEDPSLIRAYRRWQRYKKGDADFIASAKGDPYEIARRLYSHFGDPSEFEEDEELIDLYGDL